ncbi:MAG TPA: hypothetical protein VK541_14625 [Pedobacter sp.]|uniref:hypothetical protein n=1 Tax=Pedobacter sp. TaxID=1411316 RepID=UPI002C3C4B5F|nr:hypothetical protein [Pedobacter sp.]HMI03715.1 hypothetical protein [Pedobacter sp.]
MALNIKNLFRTIAGAKFKKRRSGLSFTGPGKRSVSIESEIESPGPPPVLEAALRFYGVDWTAEKVEVLRDCYAVWEDRNGPLFQVRAAYLLGKFQNADSVRLAESAKLVLLQTGQDPLNLQAFADDLKAMLKEINKSL